MLDGAPFLLPGVVHNWRAIRPQLPRIVALGLLGMVIYQTLAYFAASFTTATHMGIILCLSPLMVLAISVGVLGIPLTWGGAIGGVIALGALTTLSEYNGIPSYTQAVYTGLILILLITLDRISGDNGGRKTRTLRRAAVEQAQQQGGTS